MQKAKRLLIATMICVLAAISIFLVACNDGQDPNNGHDHKFDKWDHDDTYHWKVCSVEGCTEKDDYTKAKHELGTNGICKCGYEKAPIPGHEHTYEEGKWVDIGNGKHAKRCDDNDYTDNATAEDHTFVEGKCSKCNAEEESDTPVIPPEHTHTTIPVNKVAATCIAKGAEAHYVCSVSGCGKLFTDARGENETTAAALEIAIDPNKHVKLNLTGDKEATCLEAGYKAHYECEGCLKNYVEATAETEIDDDDDFYFQDALGHDYDDNTPWTVVDPATCTEDGLEKHECTRCDENTEGHKVTRPIDKLGHDFGTDADWQKVNAEDVADCQHGVAMERFCKHTETGCTEKQTKTSDPDMTNHIYGTELDEASEDNNYHYYLPACEHDNVPSKAEAHNMISGQCTVCYREEGYNEFYYTPGLNINTNSSKTAAEVINTALSYAGGQLVIPSKYLKDGVAYDVTTISIRAFRNKENITSVVLPSSIESVGLNAFENCTPKTDGSTNDKLTVYYGGTEEEWIELTTGIYSQGTDYNGNQYTMYKVASGNDLLKQANVHFYSNRPVEGAWHWQNNAAVLWTQDEIAAANSAANILSAPVGFASLAILPNRYAAIIRK